MGVFRRFIFVVAMTLFLLLLGLFSGLGYRVQSMKEVSFVPHNRLLYADAIFQCDVTFNPVLFPFYWIMGAGHLEGNFSTVIVPEGLLPVEQIVPVWGMQASRIDSYITRIVTWGIFANAIVLFVIALFIEVIGKRVLYSAIFLCMIGFAFAGLIGAATGLFVGAFAVAYVVRKAGNSILEKFWRSLWE